MSKGGFIMIDLPQYKYTPNPNLNPKSERPLCLSLSPRFRFSLLVLVSWGGIASLFLTEAEGGIEGWYRGGIVLLFLTEVKGGIATFHSKVIKSSRR